jgi:hypothetical protein
MSLPDRPQFGLSHSRDRMMSECERRYYLHYYASWRGWERDAAEAASAAYRCKKLMSLSGLLGSQVHERARDVALAIRAGHDIPALDDLVRRTCDAMNAVWQASRDRESFLRRPSRHPMLMERYYGLPVSSDRLAVVGGRIRTLLSSLHAWPGWAEVVGAEPESIRLFEPLDHAEYAGVPLYAPPDLVYGSHDGATIVDWKTGREPSPDHVLQVELYHLYLHLRGLVEEDEPVTGRIVYLASEEEQSIELDAQSLERTSRRLEDSMWRARGLLIEMDEGRNEPVPAEHFPARVDEQRCGWCPMQEACAVDRPDISGPF